MSNRARVVSGVVAVLLFGWLVFLFVSRPVIDYQPDEKLGEVRVECGSVAEAGWPGNSAYLLDEHGGGFVKDSIDTAASGSLPPDATTNGIYRDCDTRRTTNVGFMALLAVPASVLAVAVVVMPRRRSELDAAARGEGGQDG